MTSDQTKPLQDTLDFQMSWNKGKGEELVERTRCTKKELQLKFPKPSWVKNLLV